MRLHIVVDRLQRCLPRSKVTQSSRCLARTLGLFFGLLGVSGLFGDHVVDALANGAPLIGEQIADHEVADEVTLCLLL